MSFLQSITSQIGGQGMISGVMTGVGQIFQWIIIGVICATIIWFYLKLEKYNMLGEIWDVRDKEIGVPNIRRKIRGGFFLEKGVRTFKIFGKQYLDAVVNINPAHLIREGKTIRFYLRREGNREYYSFIPKTWIAKDKDGIFHKVIGLEVEDTDIRNIAIIKDQQLQERIKITDKLKEMMPMVVSVVGYLALIIVAYLTFQYLQKVLSEAQAYRAACEIGSGYLFFILPNKVRQWLK